MVKRIHTSVIPSSMCVCVSCVLLLLLLFHLLLLSLLLLLKTTITNRWCTVSFCFFFFFTGGNIWFTIYIYICLFFFFYERTSGCMSPVLVSVACIIDRLTTTDAITTTIAATTIMAMRRTCRDDGDSERPCTLLVSVYASPIVKSASSFRCQTHVAVLELSSVSIPWPYEPFRFADQLGLDWPCFPGSHSS